MFNYENTLTMKKRELVSVVYMMPLWDAATEVWLQRMLEGLSKDLAAVVVNDSKGNHYWKENIPAVSLYPSARKIRYFSRIFDIFGLSLEKAGPRQPPGLEM